MLMKFRRFLLIFIFMTMLCDCSAETGKGGNAELRSEMRVRVSGENCYVSAKMDANTDIIYWFKKCMANELYTFYDVGLFYNLNSTPVDPSSKPETILNEAYSDNIGPFLVENVGWCGGNHTDATGHKTARNESFFITVDGHRVKGDTLANAHSVQIDVVNVILDTFAIEKVHYDIYGNSIEVSAEHKFFNVKPLNVQRYYGMQSMFEGETKTLTPGGEYSVWTDEANVSSFPESAYPDFRWFVERNAGAFQSAYLFRSGMGDHKFVDPNEPVFIGHSYGKSYHRLMANHIVKRGDVTTWKGVYTWGTKPLLDNDSMFAFWGNIDGNAALFISAFGPSTQSVELPSRLSNAAINVIDNQGGIAAKSIGTNSVSITSVGKGYAIISFVNK
jgi:hypothetical protein